MTSAVTALLALPDFGTVHLLLPLAPLDHAAVLALPPFADAPSSFVPVASAVLVGYETRRLSVAVFRTSASDVFLAVPHEGDDAATRTRADRLRGLA